MYLITKGTVNYSTFTCLSKLPKHVTRQTIIDSSLFSLHPRTDHEEPWGVGGKQSYRSTLPLTSTPDRDRWSTLDSAALHPGKRDPVAIVEEDGWVSGPVWTGGENFAPTGIRSNIVNSKAIDEGSVYKGAQLTRHNETGLPGNKISSGVDDNHVLTKRWCSAKCLVVDGGESTALDEKERPRN